MRQLDKSGLALRASLAMVIAVALSGCGVGGGPASNPAPRPLLTVAPSSIYFETVRVGSSSARTITMTNSGTGTLAVTQATLSGSPFALTGLALPVNLAPGQSSAFSVAFAPTSSGAVSGSLSLITNAPVPSTTVELSGSGILYQLTSAASSLNFGNVAVASTSTKTVSFTNTGTAAVTLSGISVAPAEFSFTGPNAAAILQPGQSASVAVTFSPTATGAASGTLSISSDASGSPLKVALEGTGVTYQLGVNPSSVNFGNVTVASASTEALTMTNTGTASVTVLQASVTGTGFSLGLGALSLPLTLAPGQSVALNVTFAPSTSGSATGSVSITSSASVSMVTVALSGAGITYQLSSSSSSLNFGDVAVSAKNAQTMTLTNTGTGSVTVSQVTVAGIGFTTTGLTLPATLAPGQSAALTVDFAPTQTGPATGAISVVSNASGSPLVISLAATGVTYQLAPSSSSLAFGDLTVGSTSTQTVTLTNTGTASVTISQLTLSGAGFTPKGPALPVTLTAGQSTSLSITFSPASTGSASGTISVISSASDSPLVIAFSGTGQTYQLTSTPASIDFGDVTVGDNAILPAILTSSGTGDVTISQVTTTGPGFSVTNPGLPLVVGAGRSTSLSVTFAPTVGGSATGTLTVTSTATGSPLTETLSGTGTHAVDLSWTASTSSGVTGYNVYRSNTSDGQFSVINTSPVVGTSFEDSNVTAGQTYYYKTTAIGAGGVESDFSNVASAKVPTP
ncbi:MAG TPA: choice-of-anchor D domain-containing protein [Terriglobia bacterium]|nr:choice-of-anchor D domain-containing protein [Terriglobia bacterium]